MANSVVNVSVGEAVRLDGLLSVREVMSYGKRLVVLRDPAKEPGQICDRACLACTGAAVEGQVERLGLDGERQIGRHLVSEGRLKIRRVDATPVEDRGRRGRKRKGMTDGDDARDGASCSITVESSDPLDAERDHVWKWCRGAERREIRVEATR